MSTHTALEAASLDRKARLAQLKNLKRKQPEPSNDQNDDDDQPAAKRSASPPPESSKYLSGRNYDPTSRAPKLGYDDAPKSSEPTLEDQAQVLADRTRAEAEAEENADRPLDLFKIQPKRPNWDLKRDYKKKMEVLDAKTEKAIGRIVRERVEREKQKQVNGNGVKQASRKSDVDGEGGEAIGMEGNELVEATRELEREEQEARKEREEDDEGFS